MKFTKMQGLGNDYVYVNCFEEKIENPSEVAVKVSNRNFGVGSDGLIMINPSKVADFEMEMYNADGSRGEMCGNGIRCVGKYVAEKTGTIRFYLLTAPDKNGLIVTNNRNSAQRSTEAEAMQDAQGTYVELEVQAGDEILINVAAKPNNRGKYPATTITWCAKYN